MSGERCVLCGVEILPVDEREGDRVSSVALDVRSEEGIAVQVSGDAHYECAAVLVQRATSGSLVGESDFTESSTGRSAAVSAAHFLADVVELSRQAGITIGHEDEQGGFILRPFRDSDIAWLRAAVVEGGGT